MRRDTIFYHIFQRYPALFFELIDQRPEDASRYEFTSVEVKEPTFRIDGVLLPPSDAPFKRIFFTEVQMQTDQGLHHRFFAELFLYLYRNQGTYDDWYGTLIYPSRTQVPDDIHTHRALLESDQVHCIYLNELGDVDTLPYGLALIKLMVESESEALPTSQQLVKRAKQQTEPFPPLKDIIEMVTTIIVYKYKSLSREEIEAMLDVTVTETRVYKDAIEKGELKKAVAVAKELFDVPMEPQRIAEITKLSLEQVLDLKRQSESEKR